MRMTFELGSGVERRPVFTWKRVLVGLFGLAILTCLVVVIVGALRGDNDLAADAGIVAVLILMFAAPAWIGHIVGQHEAQRSEVSEELQALRGEIQQMYAAVELVVGRPPGGGNPTVRNLPQPPRRGS